MNILKFAITLFSLVLFVNQAIALPDQMTIKVKGTNFVKRTFENETVFFTNRSYVIENAPVDFIGFEFLSSAGGGAQDLGVITPAKDGYVYIIGPGTNLTGWDLVPNSTFNYSDGGKTSLSIYQKAATTNTPVDIPLISSFPGASVIAKIIVLEDPSVQIRVKGVGIDIENVGETGYKLMFPQGIADSREVNYHIPGTYHLWDVRPSILVNKEYATTPQAMYDTRTCSMKSFIADRATTVSIAVPIDNMTASGWTKTSVSFSTSVTTMYVYNYNYTTPNTFINIPYYDEDKPTIVFGEQGHLKFDNPKSPTEFAEGVIIHTINNPYNRGSGITDPNIIILPNGDYIAGLNLWRFISKDKGQTWSILSTGFGIGHPSTFYHNGALYIMGDASDGYARINKSTDGGVTWGTVVKLNFLSRNSPSEVEVGNGRIWFANEEYNTGIVNLASAPVNSDLINPISWTRTNRVDANPETSGADQEPCMIMDKDGWPIAMQEAGPPVKASSPTEAARMFDRSLFGLPGTNNAKYTARYDAVSDKYWALTNPTSDPSAFRNILSLFSSTDLKVWKLEKEVIHAASAPFHGFQYPFMQFDGNDIVFVSRTAYENEWGQARRWHDAQFFTFHRIRNFRNEIVSTNNSFMNDSACIVKSYNRQIEISGNDLIVFDISIYDSVGRVKYSKSNSTNKIISNSNWHPGIYIVKIYSNKKLYTQKILVQN